MPIYFITGNEGKYQEVKSILPDVEKLDIELTEIQSIDAHEIIKAKLDEARKHHPGELIVEDTSLYLDCLNGLPGPFIKWFLKAIGTEGLANLAYKLENDKARAITIIGYTDGNEKIEFFEGVIEGRVVSPRQGSGFGWDPIFQPDSYDKTFAEMGGEEKNKISMRKRAVEKLAAFREGLSQNIVT